MTRVQLRLSTKFAVLCSIMCIILLFENITNLFVICFLHFEAFHCIVCGYHSQVHLHPSRRPHMPTTVHLPEGFVRMWGSHTPPREKLELFAVLCIETSHYVSFVKHGPKATDWIFFDSMADRMGKQHVLFWVSSRKQIHINHINILKKMYSVYLENNSQSGSTD